MSHSIKVKKVSEGYSQSDNESYINVQVDILKENEDEELVIDDESIAVGETIVIGEKSFGYPLSTSMEDIEEDLKRVVHSLDIDKIQADKSAKLAEELKNVESAKDLIDKEITL